MAQFIGMRLTGSEEILRRLRGIDSRIANRALKRGLRAGAKVVRDHAKTLAPRDSGRLRGSLTVRGGSRRGQAFATVLTGDRERLQIQEDATGFYPMSQEFGWVDPGGESRPGQAYLRPAIQAKATAAIGKVARQIEAELS